MSFKVDQSINSNNLKLDLYGAAGSHIKAIQLNNAATKVMVNTADLNAGIYYYTISDGRSKSAVAKLVVVK